MHALSTLVTQAITAAPPTPAPTGGGTGGGTPGSAAPGFLNTTNITGIIIFAVAIIGAGVGLGRMTKAGKSKPSDNSKVALNVFICIAIIAGSLAGVIWTAATGGLDFFINK